MLFVNCESELCLISNRNMILVLFEHDFVIDFS